MNPETSLSSLKTILKEEDEKRRVMRLQHPESLHFAGTFVRYNVVLQDSKIFNMYSLQKKSTKKL